MIFIGLATHCAFKDSGETPVNKFLPILDMVHQVPKDGWARSPYKDI